MTFKKLLVEVALAAGIITVGMTAMLGGTWFLCTVIDSQPPSSAQSGYDDSWF